MARKRKAATAKRGRPSQYREIFAKQAFALSLLGLTDKEMAGVFQVSEVTVNTWKKRHPNFVEALRNGRAGADGKVSESLYHRALGYSHTAVKIFLDEGEPMEVPYVEHYPPDPTACIFWLKNRQPGRWRDRLAPVSAGAGAAGTETGNSSVAIPHEVLDRARELANKGAAKKCETAA